MGSYTPSNLNPHRGPFLSKSAPPLTKKKTTKRRRSLLEDLACGVRYAGPKRPRGPCQSYVASIIDDPVLDLTTQRGPPRKLPKVASKDVVSEETQKPQKMNGEEMHDAAQEYAPEERKEVVDVEEDKGLACEGVAVQQVIDIPGDDPVRMEDDEVDAVVVLAPATAMPGPVQPAAKRGAVAKQARVNPGNLFPKISFRVRSLNDDDPGLEYELKINETFEKIYYDYARRVDCHSDDISIVNARGVVWRNNSPVLGGIVNGAVLWVRSQVRFFCNPVFNCSP